MRQARSGWIGANTALLTRMAEDYLGILQRFGKRIMKDASECAVCSMPYVRSNVNEWWTGVSLVQTTFSLISLLPSRALTWDNGPTPQRIRDLLAGFYRSTREERMRNPTSSSSPMDRMRFIQFSPTTSTNSYFLTFCPGKKEDGASRRHSWCAN